MEKLKMHTPDLAEENYKKLAELFPNAVTETKDEEGNTVRAIDADVLRQEISARVVEGDQERYQFTWPDKRKSIVLANAPIAKTLRFEQEKSVGRDGTPGGTDSENIYIEGDNLDALKLLQETYLGKVKMIYIDPPYNTGNDFIYEDDFSQSVENYANISGQMDEEGNRLVQNNEGNGRFHTDWLNMMYPRLKLAKDLLSDDGVIFISIDENENENLIEICNEIFGKSSFVSEISWQKTYAPRNNNLGIASEVEYVLVYGKKPGWIAKRLPRTDSMNDKYKNQDNDSTLWRTDNSSAPGASTHQGMVYAIQNPFTGEFLYPPKGRCWCREQKVIYKCMNEWARYKLCDLDDYKKRAEICGVSAETVRKDVKAIVLDESLDQAKKHANKVLENGPWPLFYFTNKGKGGLARKSYLDKVQDRTPTNLWKYDEVGHTDEAAKEIKELFDGNLSFDTPKTTRLIKRMLDIVNGDDFIVLDFFAGSSTTASAVLKKNIEDHGNRKFILVQIADKTKKTNTTISDIGEERIRRIGKKIKEETGTDIDYGFRCFKVDSTNMEDVFQRPADLSQDQLSLFDSNIKQDRTPEDLLIQVMLDLGVLLSSKIEEIDIKGKRVFSVSDGYLLACFDENVDEDVVTEIAQKKPYYAVFRDSSMADDSVAANFEQIFATYSPQTVRKVL